MGEQNASPSRRVPALCKNCLKSRRARFTRRSCQICTFSRALTPDLPRVPSVALPAVIPAAAPGTALAVSALYANRTSVSPDFALANASCGGPSNSRPLRGGISETFCRTTPVRIARRKFKAAWRVRRLPHRSNKAHSHVEQERDDRRRCAIALRSIEPSCSRHTLPIIPWVSPMGLLHPRHAPTRPRRYLPVWASPNHLHTFSSSEPTHGNRLSPPNGPSCCFWLPRIAHALS